MCRNEIERTTLVMSGNWNDCTVAELKEELQNRGLSTSGKKSELIERIQTAMASEGAPNQATLIDLAPSMDPDDVTSTGRTASAPTQVLELESARQPTSQMKVKPRQYDGRTSWRSYHNLFQRVSRINHWSVEQQLDFLWLNLTGEALEFVENLTPQQATSYTSVCQALEARFGDSQLAETFKASLRSRRRKPEESLPALAQDIHHLVRRAYPKIGQQGTEELSIEKFREALPDNQQRMAVFQSKSSTLDQAVNAAMDMESWQICEGRRSSTAKAREVAEEEDSEEEAGRAVRAIRGRTSKWTDELKELVQQCLEDTKEKDNDSKSTVRCFYCHKLGHIQRDCRKKKNTEVHGLSGNGQGQR